MYDQFGHAAFEQELILAPVDSADSRVAAMAAIKEFHFNGENMDDIFW